MAFRTDVLDSLDLREDGFRIEPEITAQICKPHAPHLRAPDRLLRPQYAEGKKITWRDGVRAVWVLIRVRVT